MNLNTTIFQSRWGYHPCNFQLFLKLKSLHRWYWQTLYDFHRWHRWWRKEPQNRVGPEPVFCPLFVLNTTWYKSVRNGGVDGFGEVLGQKAVSRVGAMAEIARELVFEKMVVGMSSHFCPKNLLVVNEENTLIFRKETSEVFHLS